MKKNKAFTIVELVIVLGVASILFAIIAGISVLIQGLVVSEKANMNGSTEYLQTKREIQQFISKYTYSKYTIELDSESVAKIYVTSDMELENYAPVAKMEFDSESKTLSFYEQDEEFELTRTNQVQYKELVGLSFEIDTDSKLLKTAVTFEKYTDYDFLINLGGIEIGYLY